MLPKLSLWVKRDGIMVEVNVPAEAMIHRSKKYEGNNKCSQSAGMKEHLATRVPDRAGSQRERGS